ncbi:hypothetical protein [Deinococcus apachensis]|uniref:hypothetical protein n=1 Tax=Deinococcus apachensis TaxID=309886 RepID=UPI00038243E6|nr:hypothetical protein [Deinococcus apachensis]
MKHALWTLPLLLAPIALAQVSKPPPITKVGDVYLTRTQIAVPGMPAQVTAAVTASFFRSTSSLAAPLTREVCGVQEGGDGPLGLTSVPSNASPVEAPTFLDAGTPLVLRAGSKGYAQLKRTRQGSRISYVSTVPTLPAPPPGLVLDIPGAPGGFPAFKGVEVPPSDLPRLTVPTRDEDVTPSTTFRWSNPTHDANTTVLLMGMQEDPELVVSCLVRDDGTFSFPPEVVAQLKAKGFTSGMLTGVGRTSGRTYRSGDAALSVRNFVLALGER